MNFIDKRKYRKLAKIFYIIAFTFIGLFLIQIILIIIGKHPFFDSLPMGMDFIVLFAPSFFALPFGIIASFNRNARMKYKENINQQRQFFHFKRILKALNEKRYDDAITMYNTLLKGGNPKNFLYGYIIATFFYSDIEDKISIAIETINEMLEILKPNNY